jgi:succinyl-CoA synthetase beta subunit
LKLFEHEAKAILNFCGIPTPNGGVAMSATEAAKIAVSLRPPFVVKAQVLIAGRGKAGGILFAETAEQVEAVAEQLLHTSIKDLPVEKILVEEQISIAKELYFGVTIDRLERKYAIIASTSGGINIEEAAADGTQPLVKLSINPQQGFTITDSQHIARQLGYREEQQADLAQILRIFYGAAMSYDAELFEMNPLAETKDGRFIAVDGKLIVDDNALFRHPELEYQQYSENREKASQELDAEKAGLAYVKLDGNIGVVGNGAGLVMATLDTIQYYRGKAADFLDLGGGAPIERITKALDIVFRNADVKVVLVNILGGITHCDDVARAIVNARDVGGIDKPLVVRLVGTNEEVGKGILDEAGIPVLESMEEAAKRAVEIAKEAG